MVANYFRVLDAELGALLFVSRERARTDREHNAELYP